MKGFIYMIELNDEIYIGSTYDLKYRTRKHNNSIRKINSPLYKYCRTNNITKVELIVIEEIEHDTREELCIIEELYRQAFNATLNARKCHRTKEELKEWHRNNKEYNKEWYQNNKEYYIEYKKVKIECDICSSFVRRDGISEHKKAKKCINLSQAGVV